MPTSSLAVAPSVVHLVETAEPHRTVLEVGPGFGKYGLLLREYLNEKPERLDAVEAWPDYVTPMMRAIYDEVMVGDVMLLGEPTLAQYDVVLMADVIEHLGKSDALELLGRIPGRIVVSTPAAFFDQGDGLPWTEHHRSAWTIDDFAETGRLEIEAPGAIESLGAILVRLGPRP